MRLKPALSIPFLFIMLSAALLLTGCDPLTKSISLGEFVDSPVEGLEYKTKTLSGKTNKYGKFQYLTGESVVFSIGNIRFPSVSGGKEITPLSVFSVNNLNNTAVVNMLRLLQTLDQDGNPNNGISISAKAIEAAAGLSVNFSAANFDAQVATFIKNAGAVNSVLVSANEAIQHFRGALPYRSSDIVGAWGMMELQTPQTGTLNSSDFGLNFTMAIVGADEVISLSPLQSNPTSQSSAFNILSNISDLSLINTGPVRGQIIEQGSVFDFAYLGASKDISLGYRTANTRQEISISVKVSLEYVLRDLAGTWKRFSLITPNNNNADPSQYNYFVEKHVINEQGTATWNIIASNNTVPTPSNNQYTFSFSHINNLPVAVANGNNYAINASKTVMINPIFSAKSNQFSIMLKQATKYAQEDLTGTWYGISLSTPQQNQSYATFFDTDVTRLIIDEKGKITATDILLSKTIAVNGFSLSIDTAGKITTSPKVNGTSYWAMDATKTMLMVLTINSNNAQKVTVLIKQSAD